MVILGVWDGHDAGAAILVDGVLVAAVNEERLSRRKLEACFPHRSIGECMDLAGISSGAVDHVAVATHDIAKTLARLVPATREKYYRIRRRMSPLSFGTRIGKRLKHSVTLWPGFWGTDVLNRNLIKRDLEKVGLGNTPLHLCDHHESHAATAAWFSGMLEATVLTLDGVGDGLSGSAAVLSGGMLHPLVRIGSRDSLGLFFEHVTNLLNMRELEDEGKVMALSDYSPPCHDHDNLLLNLFRVEGMNIIARLQGDAMVKYLRGVLWSNPWERFAHMAQRTLENVAEQWVIQVLAKSNQENLALAGGVFSNIRLNAKLRRLPQVKGCFIFPHMGDGGLAAGAAVLVQKKMDPNISIKPLTNADLGRSFSQDSITHAISDSGWPWRAVADPAREAAGFISRGEIIGWFQGGMEYGPRSLGHRSILAAADHDGIRDRLNLALKRRAWYQPFCPSMLEEEAEKILLDYDGRCNPFMTMGYHLRPAFRQKFAQVASIDGSCRPQMVREEDGLFYNLLRELQISTGNGIVLNTSFNLHGFPLVHTPKEAIEVLQQTPMTALVIGNFVVERPSQ